MSNSYSQSWSSLTTGANNDVYAMTVYNNSLVVSGNFTTAGGVTANRVAVWNGTSWSTLGTGFNNKVFALIVYNGNLIAGGSFTTAGGVSANRIAKWNGTSWSQLGSGIDNGQVNTLAVYSGNLIAGGTFTSINSTSMERIAKWNGTAWSVLANGIGNEVCALSLFNGNLIVGGKFTSAGIPNSARIVMWNGSAWTPLGLGIGDGQVYVLQVYNNNLIVGGSFTQIGSTTYNRVASWNGSAWSGLSSGMTDDVTALQVYSGDLYAGGKFNIAGGSSANLIAKWNGATWSALGTGLSGSGQPQVFSLCAYDGLLFTAGNFNTAGGQSANNIAKWGSAPVSPTLISPPNNSVNQSLTLTLDWSDVSNASSYGIQISTSSSFTTTVVNVSGLTVSQYTVASGLLNNNTTYYWRANAANGQGSSTYSSYWQFTTSAFGVPTLISPTNGATGQPLTLNLVWNASAGATSYWIQLSTNSGFSSFIINDSTVTDTLKSVSGLSQTTTYYWRISAKNAGGSSGYSAVWNFTTLLLPPAPPQVVSPTNGAVNQPLSLNLVWRTSAGATTYWVQLSTNSEFTSFIINDSTVTDTVKAVSGLSQTTTYYWRVSAKNAAGSGEFTSAWNFTTLSLVPSLSIKVYLEGFYSAEPTDGKGENQKGTRGNMKDGPLAQVADTINIYLADSTQNYAFKDSVKVFLPSTGTYTTPFANVSTGKYYIVIKHRNHLETWSKYAVDFTGGSTTSYDFTTAASQAYGDNMKQIGSVWVLYGGDPNQDGDIGALDIPIFISQFGTQGYLSCDFNGDDDVTGVDQQILIQNFGITMARPGTLLETKPIRRSGLKEFQGKSNEIKNNR